MAGTIESIHLVDREGGAPRVVASAEAVPGLGLEGDRLVTAARAAGEPSVPPHKQLTLIAAESIEAADRDHGVRIPSGATRRNVVVRGLDVDAMVGRTLRVGAARVRGVEPCDPCGYLQRTSGIDGITRALVDRGGLRCEVLEGGRLAVGDAVESTDVADAAAAVG